MGFWIPLTWLRVPSLGFKMDSSRQRSHTFHWNLLKDSRKRKCRIPDTKSPYMKWHTGLMIGSAERNSLMKTGYKNSYQMTFISPVGLAAHRQLSYKYTHFECKSPILAEVHFCFCSLWQFNLQLFFNGF